MSEQNLDKQGDISMQKFRVTLLVVLSLAVMQFTPCASFARGHSYHSHVPAAYGSISKRTHRPRTKSTHGYKTRKGKHVKGYYRS